MPHVPSCTSDKRQLPNTQLAIHFLTLRVRLQAPGVKFFRKTPPALYSIFSYIDVIQSRRNPNLSWAVWKWYYCKTPDYTKFYIKNWCVISGIHGGKESYGEHVISSEGNLKVIFIHAIDEDLATVQYIYLCRTFDKRKCQINHKLHVVGSLSLTSL